MVATDRPQRTESHRSDASDADSAAAVTRPAEAAGAGATGAGQTVGARAQSAVSRATALADAAFSAEGRVPTLADGFALLEAAGLLTAPLPHSLHPSGSDLDGRRATLHPLLRVLHAVGYVDQSLGRVYEGHVNALHLILTWGTAEQQARWAADAAAGHTFGVWNTEAGDGLHLHPDAAGDLVRLSGAKTFGSGAGTLTRVIAPGKLPDGGWQMSVVPLDSAPVTIDASWWQPMGMEASASGKVGFDDVRITRDDLLGEPGVYHRQPWFAGGAVRFAAVHLGGAEALLDAARRFLQQLHRTEDPYQRQRFGRAASAVASGHAWLRYAAERVDLDPCRAHDDTAIARSLLAANMTRLAIADICLQVADLVQHAVGARGLMQPVGIEQRLRDLLFYVRQPAPDSVLASVGATVLDTPGRVGHLLTIAATDGDDAT